MAPASSFLLTHFDRLAEAPGGIEKLRALLMQLAVEGKLGTQEPKDEPASKLRDRILAEKKRLIAAGKLGRDKEWPQNEDATPAFNLPASWIFSTLAEIGSINPRNDADDDQDSSFVPMKLINAELRQHHGHEVRKWAEIKKGFTHFAEGDVTLAKITPCFENRKSSVMRGLANGIGAGTTELHVVRPVLVDADYILIFLKSPLFVEAGIPEMTGTAGQKRIPTSYFASSPFPLPPLAEQRRIVAKVEELMALCDALETAQREREAIRTRLRTSALHQLATTDSDSKSAALVLQNLSPLTTSPDDFDKLRQSVLQLAVCGRLTSQRSSDRPAALDKAASSSTDFDQRVFSEAIGSLETPPNWSINPLAKTAAAIVDCPHSTPKWTEAGKMCVRTNQFRPGYLDLSDVPFVSEATYAERIQRLEPKEDDILYSREGGILGVACRVPANIQLCLGQRMMLIRPSAATEPAFLEMVLNSPLITGIALNQTTGGAAPRVNVSTVRAYPIPLPPLAEQRRIVAKVDELMVVLDALEATLSTAHTTSERLLAATIAKLHAA